MTNDNQEEQRRFESSFEDEFANSFDNILEDLKKQSITPVVQIFVAQIEKFGYTLEEILWSLSAIVNERDWGQATRLLEDAAREIGRQLSAKTPSESDTEE